jgi:hypothetical protein
MIKGLKFGFWVGFVTLLVLTASAAAHAATPRSSSTVPRTDYEPPHVFLSAAVNQGTSSLSNPVAGSTGNSGSRTELMLLATVELGSLVFEGGGGWMHDKLTGTGPANGLLSPSEYEVVTDAGIAELSPRYRVVGGLEIGPLVELLYGADLSFAPGFGTSGQTTAWLGGGQALYGFTVEGASLRAGARYTESLNVANHSLRSVQATLQIGLPVL